MWPPGRERLHHAGRLRICRRRPESRAMHSNGHAPHILVLDPAPESANLTRELLEAEGFRVTAQLRTDQDLAQIAELVPDLIVVDYMWPHSDNEWTLLNLLRVDGRTRDIPVILCTGAVGQVRNTEANLQALGIRVVLKPFHIGHLVTTIRTTLNLDPVTRAGTSPTEI